MKEYTFIAYCSFGNGYSGETEVTVELTTAESKRLNKYGKQAEIYYDGFENCEQLKDIYKKVYDIAIRQMTEEMIDFGDNTIPDDANWKVDDNYTCSIDFPPEFEEDLIDD